MTQAALGKAVGHHQNWVSRFVAGTQDADVDELAAMAAAFNHTITELLDARADPNEQRLLDAYRALPERKRTSACLTLELMLPDPPKKRRLPHKP